MGEDDVERLRRVDGIRGWRGTEESGWEKRM